jgi:hypothetical protein
MDIANGCLAVHSVVVQIIVALIVGLVRPLVPYKIIDSLIAIVVDPEFGIIGRFGE